SEILDRVGQVPGKGMALRSGVGGRLLGRGPLCRRGAILDHMGREKVGCCGLSAITLHAEIMSPPAAASNLDSGLNFLRQKRRRRTRAKKQPRARLQSSGKKCLLVWPVCRTGGWGAGAVRRAFTARIYSPPRRAARGPGEPRKADRTAISMDCCKAPY